MTTDKIITISILCAAFVSSAHGAKWDYEGDNGPDTWADLDGSFCGENSQSPINIVLDDTDWEDLGDFVLAGYDLKGDNPGTPSMIENNGHSLTVNLDGNYALSGGGLPAKYMAEQFHFHWGSKTGQGSEHMLDGESYDAEMHIVHYNSDKYNSFSAAAEADDAESLAVLGVFLQISGTDNEAFSKVLEVAALVPFDGDGMSLENDTFSVADLLPEDLGTYFRYNGSLTTPGCNEIVIWTVFRETVSISEDQIKVLRGLYKGEDDSSGVIDDNYRPVQALNDRVVYFNSAPSILAPSVSLLMIMALNAAQQMVY